MMKLDLVKNERAATELKNSQAKAATVRAVAL